ncbi:hypothetical protein ACWGI0_23055 [Streptomyces sp. NPDC054802]
MNEPTTPDQTGCAEPDHACPRCGDCQYEHPGADGCRASSPAAPQSSPLASVIEVRDPCPHCEDCPLIPRHEMIAHIRSSHPGAVVDFPLAFRVAGAVPFDQHDPRCSWPRTSGALLCDCYVVTDGLAAVVIHACPPDGSGLTPCCGRTPFEIPRSEYMTTVPGRVTCTVREGSRRQRYAEAIEHALLEVMPRRDLREHGARSVAQAATHIADQEIENAVAYERAIIADLRVESTARGDKLENYRERADSAERRAAEAVAALIRSDNARDQVRQRLAAAAQLAADERDRAYKAERRLDEAEAARDGAYRERAHLVALLAAMTTGAVIVPAVDVDEPGWQIAYLTIGGRQASWHISPADADLFGLVPRVASDDPRAQWDGHSTEEKYAHIREQTAELWRRCGTECSEGHTYTDRCEGAHRQEGEDR